MIRLHQLTKAYQGKQPVLEKMNFTFEKDGFFFLTGVSGAGKTSLFQLLLLLELPTSGEIWVNERLITKLPPSLRPAHRRSIGMVFQDVDNRILQDETVEKNVSLPLSIYGMKHKKLKHRVESLLDKVGLLEKRKDLARSLSGGQKQLMAIARALVFEPKLVLADEPTGNLDQIAANQVMEVLQEVQKKEATVLVATHDLHLIRSYKAKTLLIKDKKLHEVRLNDSAPAQEEKKNPTP